MPIYCVIFSTTGGLTDPGVTARAAPRMTTTNCRRPLNRHTARVHPSAPDFIPRLFHTLAPADVSINITSTQVRDSLFSRSHRITTTYYRTPLTSSSPRKSWRRRTCDPCYPTSTLAATSRRRLTSTSYPRTRTPRRAPPGSACATATVGTTANPPWVDASANKDGVSVTLPFVKAGVVPVPEGVPGND